jgi:two-component system sensor histidine kinase PilS (NtrC family)
MRSESKERSWLSWLSKVRIIVITFLLAIELAIMRLTVTSVPERAFLTLIGLWYAIAVFYVLVLSVWREHRTQSQLQVITDLLFANAIIYLTGGIDTTFNFLNPLIIIVACILLPRAWAYLTALLSFILFGGILELSFFDLIHSYSSSRPDPNSLQLVIFINLFAYVAVAYLASKMVARLRQIDLELQDKRGALENLQALHKSVIDSMSGGLITTDLEGHISLLNPAGEKLMDTSADAVFGKPVTQFFIDPLPPIGPHPVHNEIRCLTPKGEEKTFGITASELNVPDRGLTGYVYAFADLTEIRRLERELRMNDRLAAVGRMAGGIAHEIRNPLTSIAGSVQVLAGLSELTPDQKSLVDIVLRESDRLNAIITDFLLYAREKVYKLAVVDLIPLIEDALATVERTHAGQSLDIVRRFETDCAWTLADRDRLKQVFTTLAKHAFRPLMADARLAVTIVPTQGYWQIRFVGNGQGLTAERAEKLFEPFQADSDGTGMGLAIAYQTLQAHDARVSARSLLREGIEFSIELMRSEAPARTQFANIQPMKTKLAADAGQVAGLWFAEAATPSGVKNG